MFKKFLYFEIIIYSQEAAKKKKEERKDRGYLQMAE